MATNTPAKTKIRPPPMVSMFFRGETSASFFGSGVGLVASWDTPKIEDGSFYCGELEISGIQVDVKNASITGLFPIEMFFNVKGAVAHIDAEYDFKKQYLKIKNAIFKSDKKNIIISRILPVIFLISIVIYSLPIFKGNLFYKHLVLNVPKEYFPAPHSCLG